MKYYVVVMMQYLLTSVSLAQLPDLTSMGSNAETHRRAHALNVCSLCEAVTHAAALDLTKLNQRRLKGDHRCVVSGNPSGNCWTPNQQRHVRHPSQIGRLGGH
jgi:hypothetical protein